MVWRIPAAVIWGIIAGAVSSTLTTFIVLSKHLPDVKNLEIRTQFIERKLIEFEKSTLPRLSRLENKPSRLSSIQENTFEHSSLHTNDELKPLLSRVEAVESALARLEDRKSDFMVRASGIRGTMSNEPVQAYGEYKANNDGENAFKDDSGPELGVSEEIISDIFHELNKEIIPQEIYCKASICKITLNAESTRFHSNSKDGLDPVDALAFGLSDHYGVGDIDVDYAIDEQGNRVIYIRAHTKNRAN